MKVFNGWNLILPSMIEEEKYCLNVYRKFRRIYVIKNTNSYHNILLKFE